MPRSPAPSPTLSDTRGAIAVVAGLTAASGLWVLADMPGRPADHAVGRLGRLAS